MPTDMTRGPIFPMLMRFMLPLLIGDIFQRLYNCLLYTSDAADEL